MLNLTAAQDPQTFWSVLVAWAQNFMPRLLGAVLILAIGWALSNFSVRLMKRAMSRTKADLGIITFLGSLIKTTLKILVCIIAASQLGVDVTSIIAALGAAGLTIGLALKDSMSNVASGAQIIFTKPFRVGDYLLLNEVEGTVERIEILYTTLRTFDNKEIIIPNSQITASTITNFTAMKTRRLDLSYGIGYGDDLLSAKKLLARLAEENPLVLETPAPVIGVDKHDESCVTIAMKVWCNTNDYWTLYYDMQERVKLAFDEAGIHIPFPQMDVHIQNAG